MRVSAGLPTGMEGLTYPIPFSDPENVIRIAQAAEKFGYDSVWGNDHMTTQNYVRAEFPVPPRFWEPLVTYAFVLSETKTIKVGTMLEVPSLLWQLDGLLKRADFISVGTNDLLQFIYAADRGNTRLANRYDPLSPPMLQILKRIIDNCGERNVEVSICGEMAGRPLDALALLALGFRNLSMSASGIGPVRAAIRAVHLSDFEPFVIELMGAEDSSVRETLRAFALDRGVTVV